MIEKKLKKLRHWFSEKSHLIELYFKNKNGQKLICNMGEIYFAKIGINIGAEIDKHRPVLIFQGNNHFVRNSDLIFVFPITSSTEKKKYKVLFDKRDVVGRRLEAGGILIQQGKSISKTRLLWKMGILNNKKLKEVKNTFENFLYKNTTLEP